VGVKNQKRQQNSSTKLEERKRNKEGKQADLAPCAA
jgi:hypothetical protein